MRTWLFVITIIGFLSPIAAFQLWHHSEIIKDDNLIDKGWALGILCLSFVGWKSIRIRRIKMVFIIGFWLAVNNAFDEFFFTPLEDYPPEYIYVVLVIVCTVWLYLKYEHPLKKRYKLISNGNTGTRTG